MSATPELEKGLNQRQLNMIAIGGVIGAGLFVGSSVVLNTAGPGALRNILRMGISAAPSIARDHFSRLPSPPVLAVEEQP